MVVSHWRFPKCSRSIDMLHNFLEFYQSPVHNSCTTLVFQHPDEEAGTSDHKAQTLDSVLFSTLEKRDE